MSGPGDDQTPGALDLDALSRLAMERRARRRSQERPTAIPRRGGTGPARASFAQQRLWLLDRLQPGSHAYSMPFAYRLTGHLDRVALERALAELVRRHEALRTSLREQDGEPIQVIAAPDESPLVVAFEDLAGHGDAEDRERLLAERLEAEAATPFDLAAGPLVRARLYRLDRPAQGSGDAPTHVLLMNFHHAVFDGWSVGVLWRELAELYSAFLAGEPSPLAPPPLQYADFSDWQRRRLEGPEQERHLAYWRERLADPPAALDLPTDLPRPSQPSERGTVVEHRLPLELAERLRAFARERGGSLFMALLTGFQVLLSRLSGQRDLLVGVPDAGRSRTELEGVVGFFINALAIRARLADDTTFESLFASTRQEVLGATAHHEVPLEKLLEELQPERSQSRASLFQVMFNMIDLDAAPPVLDGLAVEEIDSRAEHAKFDLTIYAQSEPDGILLSLRYSRDLFEPPRVAAMLDQYQHLLAQAVDGADRPVASLSLVPPSARRVLPEPDAPLDTTWRGPIHQALARRAAEAPARVAAVDLHGTLTYQQLAERAHRLAHHLGEAGVGRGDTVAIFAHRDASLAVAVYGALAAGAAFSVLDPGLPAARLVTQIELMTPAASVELAAAGQPPPAVEAALDAVAPRCRVTLPARGTAAEADVLAERPTDAPQVTVGPDDPASVVFTSGSTGIPKGVVGRHGSLTHFLPWWCERFGLGADDRFSVASALSHDPLQRDLFVPVWLGAPMVFPDPARLGEPGFLAAWMAAESIAVTSVTPAMLQLLDPAGTGGRDDTAPLLPSLRVAFVIGDALTRAHVERLRRLAPGAACFNLYGSTETQRALAVHPADTGGPGKEVLALGRGIPDVQLLVVHEGSGAVALAGIGEPGEIWVRSPHLALGYLGDPELTALRFLANPFAADPEPWDRVYRTGDVGRYLPDGGVEFAGRVDSQVKVRGFRVETGEVESVLAEHPGVAECAVAARDDLPGGRGLAAWVVRAAGSATPTVDLRAHLAERLPDYMVPRAFVMVDALPRSATGKIERSALPAPTEGDLATGLDRVRPRDEMETLLAGLWEELLGLPEVGVEDDFFALGGHSLLATRLIARVRSLTGREIPLAVLFETPTVAALARHVEGGAGDARALPPVERLSEPRRAEPLPLAWGQRRIWFLERLGMGAETAYNMIQALELDGELDVGALEAAVGDLVGRHEPLRTRITADADGQPWLAVDPPPAGPVALPVADLADGPPDLRDRRLDDWLAERAEVPFDLAAEWPARWALARLGERRWVLAPVIHHTAVDGWSFGVLFDDLAALYRARVTGEPAVLAELPVTYSDWAAWQRSWLEGPELERQLDHWRLALAGAPTVLELPTDRARPPQQSFRGARFETVLGPELTGPLGDFCRRTGVTPSMALLSAFGALLGRMVGVDDLLVGTPIANRRSREIEPLVGLFTNLLPLRVDLAPGPDGAVPGFAALARRVRAVAIGAYGHQDLPFERLVDALDVERDLSRPPLAQVLFAFQNSPAPDLDLPALAADLLPLPGTKSQTDLYLQAAEQGDSLRLAVEYCTDLVGRETVERLMRRFARLLAAGLDDPATPVDELPWFDRLEEAEVLQAGSGGAPAPAGADTLHGLVAATALAAPERLAVTAGGESLTYGDLIDGARRLGHHLRRLGAGRRAPVAVLVERTPALVTTLLGVLEAGASYLPLDPSHPPERLAAMAEDAGVELLVTETAVAGRVELPGVVRVVVDGADREAIAARPATPVVPDASASDRAYVLYTSGSTGRPKGVEIEHRAAVAFLAAMAGAPGVGPEDVVLATTTIGFDISLLELFLPLMVGARIELVDRRTAADGPALARMLDGVSVAQATPTSWKMLLASGWAGRPGLKVLSGGEALDQALAEALLERIAPGELWNVYGPTETTVWSSTGRVLPGGATETAPIGAPIPGTRLSVVDRRGRLVPPGVAGELWIAGAGVARGYLHRPDLTAGAFVPDPFAERTGGAPGDRAYRTGDLVRRHADGRLECLGRIDSQVKVRGHRIEPGEIEAVLVGRADLAQAVVTTFGEAGESRRLAAYVVLAPGADEPEVGELRAHLEERLPPYMVPAAFVVLPALPRTASGKVDRNALPAPEAHRLAATATYRPPATDAERTLASVWSEVLGVERVGLDDRFFHLGGDSILAIQVVARAGRAGWRLAVADLFRHPALGELAAVARPDAPSTLDPEPVDEGEVNLAGLSEDDLEALLREIG